MRENQPARESAQFCSQCGARLPAQARFCPGCGRTLAGAAGGARPDASEPARGVATDAARLPARAAPSARSLRAQLPGLVVLVLFLAVGLGIWVRVLRPGTPEPGGPTRQAPPPAAGELPPDHPPLALPEEGKKFIASLVAKAEAVPTDVGAWRTLAQVQTRAAEIDPTYAAGAIESYRRVLALAPDDAEAMRALGNVFYDQQQFAAAAEQYEKYLERRPDDPSVRTDLATTYLYQRQVDRAIAAYGEVIAKHSDFMQAHFNLGLAYEAKGDHAMALASLAKARSLASDDATRAQIDRVTAQVKGEEPPRLAAPGALAQAGKGGASSATRPGADAPSDAGHAGTGPPSDAVHGGAGSASGTAPAAGGFRGAVEAALRAHQILGPKISRIEWPDPTHARVVVHDFPMQAMPESVRGLFRGRLETMLDDAKTANGVAGETAIEIVDAASGTAMERATR